MNKDQLEGKWKQIKGKFKQKYANVTDDDLTYSEGKFDEMLGKLQEKTGKKKEEILEEIDNWIAQLEVPDKGSKKVTHTGVGIYHYIEPRDEKKTFKEKLAAEGLLKE